MGDQEAQKKTFLLIKVGRPMPGIKSSRSGVKQYPFAVKAAEVC